MVEGGSRLEKPPDEVPRATQPSERTAAAEQSPPAPVPGAPAPASTVDPTVTRCANCEAALTGPFCSTCGQRNTNLAVSLRVLARDFADEYLSFDSRLFRSVLALLLQPGHLTRQYLLGRRERYVRPLRLYLVTSLLFFFAFSIWGRPMVEIGGMGDASIRELIEERGGTITTADVEAESPAAGQDAAPADETPGLLELTVSERIEHLGSMRPQELATALATGMERQLPRTMFILLPLFALLLKVLYLRGKWFYPEHFIFTLHFHSFAFTIFLLLLLLPSGWWTAWLLGWTALYLLVSMHRVYRQSIWKSVSKFALLIGLYSGLLLVAVLGSVVLTLLLI